jgi:hypothetical protein
VVEVTGRAQPAALADVVGELTAPAAASTMEQR